MKIYLDTCCLNRPFDSQEHILVKLEAEAKLQIQQLILNKQLELVWSFILTYENADNPFTLRKQRIALWEALAADCIVFSPSIQLAANELASHGIKPKNAWHVACAMAARVDYFLTTDQKLLNKPLTEITLINPVDFLRRYYDAK